MPGTVKISVRIPTDLHRFMKEHSKENERSFSRELVFLLRKVIKSGEGAHKR